VGGEQTIYLAFGVNLHALKEVLGMWVAEAKGRSSGRRS